MNADRPQDGLFSEDDQLDELLRRAQWPGDSDGEVSAAVDRILDTRPRLAASSPPSRVSCWIAAVLVMSLLLTVGITLFVPGRRPFLDTHIAESVPTPLQESPLKMPEVSIPPTPTEVVDQQWKPPHDPGSSIVEQTRSTDAEASSVQPTQMTGLAGQLSPEEVRALVIWHAERRHRRDQKRQQRTEELARTWQNFSDTLENKIHALRNGETLLLPTLFPATCAQWEQQLWKQSRSKFPEQRAFAVTALGIVGTRRSLSVLHLAMEDRQIFPLATVSLTRLASGDELTQLVLQESRPIVRRYLLAGLICKGTPQATEQYLDFVYQRSTRGDALTCLRLINDLPASPLASYLTGKNWERGQAAALTLAIAKSSDITPVLEQQLQTDSSDPRVWMAAIARPEADLKLLLKRLSRNPAGQTNARQATRTLEFELAY